MPIYMDRHDVSKEVTAENVAQLHQEDLKVQDKFKCRGLTYWFDDKRKTAFCLVEAPNAESVHEMHNHAHGEVPHSIIEVDERLVESFLGRMEDPEAKPGDELIVIDEPAFRFLLSIQIRIGELKENPVEGLTSTLKEFKYKLIKVVNEMNGTVVRQDGRNLLVSLRNVQDAIHCGSALFGMLGKRYPHLGLSIGLDAGLPVEGNKSIFEDTIKTSRRLCEVGRGFSVSPLVQDMYKEEESSVVATNAIAMNTVGAAEMIFLYNFYGSLETIFSNSELRIEMLSSNLGFSRSQMYRNSIAILGCSPNTYLNKYRLERSLDMLMHGKNSVSETAFLCGFSSSSYYSKCFHRRYGIPPKEYIKALHM
ncbi:nickel-binding protein [Maribacter sp. CXY002]|uniref:nickel-binding protein n=1 Tax=Maribacter luteocoastalis TaxID=3407671 RepID=UPI003B67FC92